MTPIYRFVVKISLLNLILTTGLAIVSKPSFIMYNPYNCEKPDWVQCPGATDNPETCPLQADGISEPIPTCPPNTRHEKFIMPNIIFNLIERNTREEKEEEKALKIAKIKSDKKLLKAKMDSKKYKPPPPTPASKPKPKLQPVPRFPKKVAHKAASDTLILPYYDEFYGEGEEVFTNPNPSLESLNPVVGVKEHEEGFQSPEFPVLTSEVLPEPNINNFETTEEKKDSISHGSNLSDKSKTKNIQPETAEEKKNSISPGINLSDKSKTNIIQPETAEEKNNSISPESNLSDKSKHNMIHFETTEENKKNSTSQGTTEDKKNSVSHGSNLSVKSKRSSQKLQEAKHKTKKHASKSKTHQKDPKSKKSITTLLFTPGATSEHIGIGSTTAMQTQVENPRAFEQEPLDLELEEIYNEEGINMFSPEESSENLSLIISPELNAETFSEEEVIEHDLYKEIERRFSEKLEIFNEITLCQRINNNDVSYAYALRRSHSEPSFQQPLNPILQVKEPFNPMKRSMSMENLVLSKTDYPALMLEETTTGPIDPRTRGSELKQTYSLSSEATQEWKDLKELKSKRYSIFNELFSKGLVVDSMEVPGLVDNLDYLVEADESAFRGEVDYARVVLKTKNIYVGNMKNWYFEGPGRYSWLNGTFFQGNFKQGLMHGEGIILGTDRSIYEGAFIKGQRVGWGIFATAAGYLYAGEWKDGLPHGDGKMWYNPHAETETDYYYGEFQKGKYHGRGIRQYENGDRYVGEFEKGLRWGNGTMIWLNERQVYKGSWENGLPHGKGEHIWYLGRTDNSCLVSRNVYKGDFQYGMRHGVGRYVYACGSVYEGQWYHGQRHNKGVYISPVGEPLFGFFRFGSILGGDEIPLHSPTYACDFLTLVETLTFEFSLDPHLQELDAMNISHVVIKYISELRLLFKRAGFLGQCYGNQGIYPFWIQKESNDPKDTIGPFVHMKKVYEDFELDSNSPDNVNPLTRFGFWLLLRDTPGITNGIMLAEFDRLWNTISTVSFQTRHHPFEGVFLWQFLQCLVAVAVVIAFELPRRKEKFAEYKLSQEEEDESEQILEQAKPSTPAGSPDHEEDEIRRRKKSSLSGRSKMTVTKGKKKAKKNLKLGKSNLKSDGDKETVTSLNSLKTDDAGDTEIKSDEEEEDSEAIVGNVKESLLNNETSTITTGPAIIEEKFYISQSTTPIPPMRISDAFEHVLRDYFIPCLGRDPGFYLPTCPSPLPPLGDLYNVYLALEPNATGLVSGSVFVSSMVPPVPTFQTEEVESEEIQNNPKESIMSHASIVSNSDVKKSTSAMLVPPPTPNPATARVDRDPSYAGPQPESDDFLGGRPSLGDAFAELVDKSDRRRSRGISLFSKAPKKQQASFLFPSKGKTRGMKSKSILVRTVSENEQGSQISSLTVRSLTHYSPPPIGTTSDMSGALNLEDQEAEIGIESDDDDSDESVVLETIPLNDDELPQEPFLWDRELTCKFDKESMKPLKHIREQDVVRVLRKLFPSIHGLPMDADMNFDMTFCDWLLAVSMLAKLSTDREIFNSITKQSEFDHVSKTPHRIPQFTLYYSPNELPLQNVPPETCLDRFPIIPPQKRVLQKHFRKLSSEEKFAGESATFDSESTLGRGSFGGRSFIGENSQAGTDFSIIRTEPNVSEEEEEEEEAEQEKAAKVSIVIPPKHHSVFGQSLIAKERISQAKV